MLKVSKTGIDGFGYDTLLIAPQLDQLDMNYIISNTILTENVTEPGELASLPIDSISQTIQYFDGIGRPLQTVVTQGSPSRRDIVQPISYENVSGEELYKYLPYVDDGLSGRYKDDFIPKDNAQYASPENPQYQFYQGTPLIASDQVPYSTTVTEASLLHRPEKSVGAGLDWTTNNRNISYAYLLNLHGTSAASNQEKIIMWNTNSGLPVRLTAINGGYYPTASLTINSTTDEQGNEVREYTDLMGRLIVKKVYVTGTANVFNTVGNWAETDYIYNDFGQLAFVLQPELASTLLGNTSNPTATQLNSFAFQYVYDALGRMKAKKIPGADWVYMVYDNRDRLVMTQDGNQRVNDLWAFTKYDSLNRPVLTGIRDTTVTLSQEQMHKVVNDF